MNAKRIKALRKEMKEQGFDIKENKPLIRALKKAYQTRNRRGN